MQTVEAALLTASETLKATSESPRLDAEILLSHVLDLTRTQLRLHPTRLLTDVQNSLYQTFIHRRQTREPIAYLVEKKEFWSLSLRTTAAVLVPRPETELLVETVLSLITTLDARIADLGTGSGAIALALASEKSTWQLIATDICLAALTIATHNAIHLGLENVEFRQGSWTDVFSKNERFDAIVSNPPYLAIDDPHLKDTEISHEPRHALVADKQGLADYHTLALTARDFLKPHGLLIVEHGAEQASAVQAILRGMGFKGVQTLNDLAALPRVTYGYNDE